MILMFGHQNHEKWTPGFWVLSPKAMGQNVGSQWVPMVPNIEMNITTFYPKDPKGDLAPPLDSLCCVYWWIQILVDGYLAKSSRKNICCCKIVKTSSYLLPSTAVWNSVSLLSMLQHLVDRPHQICISLLLWWFWWIGHWMYAFFLLTTLLFATHLPSSKPRYESCRRLDNVPTGPHMDGMWFHRWQIYQQFFHLFSDTQ